MKANAIGLVALICVCAKAYALSYDDAVPSADGRHNATYLGSQVRIDDNPVKVLTVIAMDWTGDGNTLALIEHLAGGSQLSLIHFVDGQWKRFEIEPPLDPYDDISVIDLVVCKDSVKVRYKVRQHSDGGYRFYVCSFDVDPATRTRSNEVTTKVTATTYQEQRQLSEQTSIKKAY